MTLEFEGVRDIDGTHYVGAVSHQLQQAWEDRSQDNDYIRARFQQLRNGNGTPIGGVWLPVTLVMGEATPGEYKRVTLPYVEPKAPETDEQRAVSSGRSKCIRPELSQNLDRYRTVAMRV